MRKLLTIALLVSVLVTVSWTSYRNAGFNYCQTLTNGFTGIKGWQPFQSAENSCYVEVGKDLNWISWNQFTSNMSYYGQGNG